MAKCLIEENILSSIGDKLRKPTGKNRYEFDSTVIGNNHNLTRGIEIRFVEFIDSDNYENQLNPDPDTSFDFVSYTFSTTPEGKIVPVLLDDYYDVVGETTYSDYHYYEGTAIIDGVKYDKWRKVDDRFYTWDGKGDPNYVDNNKRTGYCYKYTDIIIKDNGIKPNDFPDKMEEIEANIIMNGGLSGDIHNKLITNLPAGTFMKNQKITSVNLPACSIIGPNAFAVCSNLTSVNLPACGEIGPDAFAGCSNLTAINLPNCYYIGSLAFEDCANLSTLDLPQCREVESGALANINNLQKVQLGSSTITDKFTITTAAFANCPKLDHLELYYPKVAQLQTTAFTDTKIDEGFGSIYVPESLVSAYQSASNWSAYASQIHSLSEL